MWKEKTMKIIPFWILQTKQQFGLDLGVTFTKFDYLAYGSFWQLQLDLIIVRILINFLHKV